MTDAKENEVVAKLRFTAIKAIKQRNEITEAISELKDVAKSLGYEIDERDGNLKPLNQ